MTANRTLHLILLAMTLSLTACAGEAWDPAAGRVGPEFPQGADAPAPPDLEARPMELEAHGEVRVDPYYWVRERENPQMLAYLEAENGYLDAMMAHTEGFQQRLFEEMRGRIQEEDASVPYFLNGYWYYTRYEAGKEYAIHARREGSMDAPEQVMVDGNALAEGLSYFSMSGVQVSQDNRIGAFAVDTVGRRVYTIRFVDLASGELLEDAIPATTPNMAWATDNRTLLYARQDPQTLRYESVHRHRLGEDPARDELVYEETDPTYSLYVMRSKSRRYLMLASFSTLSSEYRLLPADRPEGEPQVFAPRQADHEYSVDHAGDRFVIRTNWLAENFRIMEADEGRTERAAWRDVVGHDPDVLVEGFEVFAGHLVVAEATGGLQRLRVVDRAGGGEHFIEFDEPAYRVWLSANPEYETGVLRYGYTSMTTPSSTFDYAMDTRRSTLRKETPVLGGFGRRNYVTERIFATAEDGTRIPVSIVYRKGTPLDGSSPLLQYAYGSYGISSFPTFSSARLSLLDRGFIYAIAHVRGGSEMGRAWYEQGKLRRKMNTFTDFIAVSEHLVARGYTAPERLYAMGGSAGGLLMGAVVNLRPELYHGVIAAVPFVDVVTTMLDDTIPLTTSEYDEWGNPNDPEFYKVMLAYSPYDQVRAQDYPHMLVTSGLHDSQVQYFEPTKWVAKLRDLKTDGNVLLLRTNMEAGHGGASGRFERLRETALEYAFLLELAGRRDG